MEEQLTTKQHILVDKISTFDPTETVVFYGSIKGGKASKLFNMHGFNANFPQNKNIIIVVPSDNVSEIKDVLATINVTNTTEKPNDTYMSGDIGMLGSDRYTQDLQFGTYFNKIKYEIQRIIDNEWSKYDNTFVLYFPQYNNIGNPNFYTTTVGSNVISIQNNPNITRDLLIPGGKSLIIVIEKNSVPSGMTLSISINRPQPSYSVCSLGQTNAPMQAQISDSKCSEFSWLDMFTDKKFWIMFAAIIILFILLIFFIWFGKSNCPNIMSNSDN